MSVFFTEDRGLPKGFKHADYGDATFTEKGGADIMKAVSPWDFLTGMFVTKPANERAAQVEIERSQSAAAVEFNIARQKTVRTAVMVGAGVVGLMAFALILRPRRAAAPVGGYRKKRSRRSRSRR